jgi:hypothetical protein
VAQRDPSADSAAQKKPAGRPRRTDWQEEFLTQFANHGVQDWAARSVQISPDTISRERKRDPDFAARYDQAFEASTAALEFSGYRWAVGGFPIKTTVTREVLTRDKEGNPVVMTLKTVTETVERSAAMTIFMLKSRKPDVYRERVQVEETGEGGGPIEVRITREEKDAAVGRFAAEVVRLADARRARDGAAGSGTG